MYKNLICEECSFKFIDTIISMCPRCKGKLVIEFTSVQTFKSEIENYPNLCLIVNSWWRFESNNTQHDYQRHDDMFHGMTLAFSVLGRFELSDEIDFLKAVFDKRFKYDFLKKRNLEEHF